MKVYLDAKKMLHFFRTTNNLFINNILYEIRFIDFLVHFFEIKLSKNNVHLHTLDNVRITKRL
jgi:hypothetical protein